MPSETTIRALKKPDATVLESCDDHPDAPVAIQHNPVEGSTDVTCESCGRTTETL